MRIDHLRYLLEVDKNHSISAAAQELYLGQTTLSAIVKSVEEELGFPIFHRIRSGVKATPDGEEALALIWEINSRFEEINNLRLQPSVSRPVPLILSPTINDGLALPLNSLFVEREPVGNLEFRTVSGENVGMQIIRNDGNIGLTYFVQGSLEQYRLIAAKYQIEVDVLLEDRMYLLARKDHPLASRASVKLEDVQDGSFAFLPHFNACEDSMAYVGRLGGNSRYTVYPNITQIKQAVLRQNMITVLSGYACTHGSVAGQGMVTVTLEDMQPLRLCLIHRSDSNIRYQEKVLIQCIREHFQSIAAQPL